MSRPVASFPQMGHYASAWQDLAELIDCDVMAPPPITARTLDLGGRHSPEFVCVPFKYNLGNFIEALERGADVLIQAGGGCRFSYYGEVQETILRDLGYEFDFVQISTALDIPKVVRFVHRRNPRVRRHDVEHILGLVMDKIRALDEIEEIVRRRVGFQTTPGGYEAILKDFLADLERARSREAVAELKHDTLAAVEGIAFERPEDCLRIGVVGELYVLMEPFSNMNVERHLASRGVEVHRFCTVSTLIDHAYEKRGYLERMLAKTGPYVRNHIGAEGTESVFLTLKLIEEGFDGIVHLKPFGCMPEVNAMSALQRISLERSFPILFMSYDAMTSETGVLTRIEAFCDMLEMRRGGRAHA